MLFGSLGSNFYKISVKNKELMFCTLEVAMEVIKGENIRKLTKGKMYQLCNFEGPANGAESTDIQPQIDAHASF